MPELRIALQGQLRDLMARNRKVAALGITRGVEKSSDQLKQNLRDEVVRAGLGRRLSKTWQDKTYPLGRKTSLNAAAWVYSKAPEIIRAHSEGVTIRAQKGTYLAIPTDNVPRRGFDRKKRATPGNWNSQKYGELRFVPRSSGPPLLVVDGARFTKSGRVGKQLKNPRKKSGGFKKGVSTIPMFVLVPQVSLKKRLDPQALGRQASRRLPNMVKREIDRADREIPEENGGRRRGR